jgi:hypothetical protein
MGSLAEDLLVLAVMAENAGVQSARRMPYVLGGASLNHAKGPYVSHHSPGGHGHGAGHHS